MTKEDELRHLLLKQSWMNGPEQSAHPNDYCQMASDYARISGGIVVMADFKNDRSCIYAGNFGKCLGLEFFTEWNSSFESCIHAYLSPADLVDQHISEIRFLEFMKTIPAEQRPDFILSCRLNMVVGGEEISVLYQSRYPEADANGSIPYGICSYTLFGGPRAETFEGCIYNLTTGKSLSDFQLRNIDEGILTPREREILGLLAKGMESKQVADQLYISVNTVYRHRQNILRNLNVGNTAEAVKIGLRMHLI